MLSLYWIAGIDKIIFVFDNELDYKFDWFYLLGSVFG